MNLVYKVALSLISKGAYEEETMTENLGVFLMFKQITKDEYTELMAMITEQSINDKEPRR